MSEPRGATASAVNGETTEIVVVVTVGTVVEASAQGAGFVEGGSDVAAARELALVGIALVDSYVPHADRVIPVTASATTRYPRCAVRT